MVLAGLSIDWCLGREGQKRKKWVMVVDGRVNTNMKKMVMVGTYHSKGGGGMKC